MNKKALALSVASVLTYTVPTMPVKAASNAPTSVSDSRTAGLISSCSLSISSGRKQIYIAADIKAIESMKSIGYKDISIEYSSDKVNWKKGKSVDDLLKSGSSYYLNNYSVSVKGGYYYRVSLTHYAKESGLFGSSQSVTNTSNSVWVD